VRQPGGGPSSIQSDGLEKLAKLKGYREAESKGSQVVATACKD